LRDNFSDDIASMPMANVCWNSRQEATVSLLKTSCNETLKLILRCEVMKTLDPISAERGFFQLWRPEVNESDRKQAKGSRYDEEKR
jgi:hypothetical protein